MTQRLPVMHHSSRVHFVVMFVVLGVVGSAYAFVPPWMIETGDDAARAKVNTQLPTIDTSYAANRDEFDVIRYELFLVPDFENERLDGSVSVDMRTLVEDVDFVDLDLDDTLTVSAVTDAQGSVAYEQFDDLLRLFPATPLPLGSDWSVTITYGGQPQPTGFKGFEFSTTPAGAPLLATLSQPYGARSWWPCKDTPSDKALVTMNVVVPVGMYAASNGELTARNATGPREVFRWEHEYPVCTYNVSLAVAEYVSWNETWVSPESGRELPIEYHVFPEHEEDARFDFARTREILDYYTELFGEYPFVDEKYGMAEFVWDGAMEHQTMTSYGDVFITGDRFYERIIGHELAHHWWGNSMTLVDWRDLWIHEGFATLAEGLWVERAEGEAAYRTFLRRRSNSCCGFQGAVSPPDQLFNQTVFNKAAWMLHMLRGMLGDTLFFAAVRDLAQRSELQYGSIVTEDVIQQFEDSTGQPLRWYFDQWLYREGRPDFTVDHEAVVTDEGTRVEITIEQADLVDPWFFPLELRIDTDSGTSIPVETFVAGATQRITVTVDGTVQRIVADPDEWLLKFEGEIVTATPGTPFVPARLLPNVPNPFNPRTTLRFELPDPRDVQLRILDARGRLVDAIDAGPLPAGRHALPWDGTDRVGNDVASGVYRVILQADGTVVPARSITLVR